MRGKVKTAAEMMAELRKHPEFVAREKEQEAEALRHKEEYRRAMAPLLIDLDRIGFPVESVNELYRRHTSSGERVAKIKDYRPAIPLLIKWLPKISHLSGKTDILGALAIKWTPPEVGPLLIQEFYKTKNPRLQWDIGNVIEVIGDDRIYDDIVKIVKNKEYGTSRTMFIHALAKMKNPSAKCVLMDLLKTNDLIGPAIMALGKLKVIEATVLIGEFLQNKDAWIRLEAKKALAKISKARTKIS